jgi:hypothetical protein
MEQYDMNGASPQWSFFVRLSFGIALVATMVGIYMLPGPLVAKGYFTISTFFLVFATITLSKTTRDDHESKRLHNRISEARTSKLMNEMDV